jgi:hypothetical protein
LAAAIQPLVWAAVLEPVPFWEQAGRASSERLETWESPLPASLLLLALNVALLFCRPAFGGYFVSMLSSGFAPLGITLGPLLPALEIIREILQFRSRFSFTDSVSDSSGWPKDSSASNGSTQNRVIHDPASSPF